MGVLSACRLLGQDVSGAVVTPRFAYQGVPVALSRECLTVQAEETFATYRLRRFEYEVEAGRLLLRLTLKEYENFPAAELLPEFVCLGNEPTGIVSDVQPFGLDVPWSGDAGVTVRALSGSVHSASDFLPFSKHLSLAEDGVFEWLLEPSEGRSSAAWMPFIGVDGEEQDGLEFGIGWTGGWQCRLWLDEAGLHVRAGMVRTNFRLLPGETLRQPSLLLWWRSGVTVRQFKTVIHRFMMEEKSPRDAQGKLYKPLLPLTVGGGNKFPETMLRNLDYACREQLPCDVLWVDAGWNGPEHLPDQARNCGDQWSKHVGDWRFNPGVHPAGNLRAVSDAVHARGKRFLMWVEPERCRPGTPIAQEHPEYFLSVPDTPEKPCENLLLNLGLPEARQWVIELISRLIEENGLDIYRQDFNMDPAPYWAAADAPDRVGVTEMKHIAGLYEFWDELKRRYPNLLIDNCASGGRRLDFEMNSRSHCYCRTDFAIRHRQLLEQVLAMQNATLNLLPYQPFQGSETTPADMYDEYGFISSICPGSVFTPNDWEGGVTLREFTARENEWFRKVLGWAERMREGFCGDFYPLTEPTTLAPDIWCAYQCHRPDKGTGFYAVFRRPECASSSLEISLEGCEASAIYELESYTGRRWQVTGAALRRLLVTVPEARGCELVFYRQLPAAQLQP